MGKIKSEVQITNFSDLILLEHGYLTKTQVRTLKIELLVDTGAAMVCLPFSLITQLGLRKIIAKKALTADGIKQR